MMSQIARIVGVVLLVHVLFITVARAADTTPLELFEQRLMPIFRSPEPSSCIQCHLASVDLKQYILPSHEETFVSLRDQGLIDLEEPSSSKILELIRMGDQDADAGARLIHEKTRRAEYEAFAAWVEACCKDGRLRSLPAINGEQAGPRVPEEVIRHARKSRVMDSFVRNVWSQRMRCFPCHTPHEIDESDAKHAAAIKTQRQLQEQYPELTERMNLFLETPEATLESLIQKSAHTPDGHLPLINLEDPRHSLLLLKPMSKLPAKDEEGRFVPPSSVDPVSHMGGLKMHPDDQSYKSIVSWIQDYSNVVEGRYKAVAELPADNWHATQLIVKLTDAPSAWPVGTPVQLFVHARNDDDSTWESEPIAFTQGTVTPRQIVNGALFLLAPVENFRSEKTSPKANLPRGSYLVKVYVDHGDRLSADPTLLLGQADFAGQIELKNARWREGFRSAESVSARELTHGREEERR